MFFRGRSAPGRTPTSRAGFVQARPALLPATRIARVVLVLVFAFTFLRGAMWSVTTPSFWGPDEDYHMMYVDTVAHEHRLITPSRPLFSREYSRTTVLTHFNEYGQGPRLVYGGDPKATIHELARLPASDREGSMTGRGIGVVHAPLFYLAGGAVDGALGQKAMPTRMLWVRTVSGFFGVLAVYGAWLLASVVLGSTAVALLAALIVALQPMLGYLSGLVSNDPAVVAASTLALAMMAFLLRSPPRAVQGLWLGGVLAFALAIKSTGLALLPLAALALLLQGAVYGRWRTVLRSAAAASWLVLILIGWWYIRSKLLWGTFTGAVHGYHGPGQIAPAHPAPGAVATPPPATPRPSASLRDYYYWARDWLGITYRTFWFHFLEFQAPRGSWQYYFPGAAATAGAGAYAVYVAGRWRTLLDPARPVLRQTLVLAASWLVFVAPFLVTDLRRHANGGPFIASAGRFMLPTYAPLVVCALVGLLWILRRRSQPVVLGVLAACAVYQCWLVWKGDYFERYFGTTSLSTGFHRMTYDRPEFVTEPLLWAIFLLMVAAIAGAAIGIGVIARRERASRMRAPTGDLGRSRDDDLVAHAAQGTAV
jgi:hypothetical protein